MPDVSDRCLRKLKFDEGVNTVDWSPDGTCLAIGVDPNAVEVVTAEGRRLWRKVEHQSFVMDVRWSPDGSRLASAANDQTARIWDARDGTVLVVGQTTGDSIELSWSADSRWLACGGKSVIVLDTETGEKLDDWSVPGEDTNGVGWDPNGPRLAAGFSGGIRLRARLRITPA